MEWTKLNKVLFEYVDDIANRYKDNLRSDGKSSSGNLINSVTASVKRNGTQYDATISLADYWVYVENGRRPGKFPPPNVIKAWIEQKPVYPREVDGIKMSNDSLAYLIGRKIAREGIEPGKQMEKARADADSIWLARIEDAITEDLNDEIDSQPYMQND